MNALTDLPHFARLLRAVRRKHRWTQGRMAHELCVSVRTLRDWEKGKREPRQNYLTVARTLLDCG